MRWAQERQHGGGGEEAPGSVWEVTQDSNPELGTQPGLPAASASWWMCCYRKFLNHLLRNALRWVGVSRWGWKTNTL